MCFNRPQDSCEFYMCQRFSTLVLFIVSFFQQRDDISWAVQNEEIQLTQQEIGRGAYGVVVVAEFRGLQVAAKCLHSYIISDYNRDMFVREMNIAAKLRHPNLVQFIGATLEGRPVILTELMTTSLRATLVQGPLEPAQIKPIGQDVARALNYMHLTRPDPILHRDISSANVLLNPTPSNGWLAKLSDYGSANFLRKVSTIGPGNPAYSAPEAATPSKQSIKMDVFSFGVMLVEMVIRKSPDQDIRAAQIREAKMKCVNLPTLPGLAQLIQKCVDGNPARRPTIGYVLSQLS